MHQGQGQGSVHDGSFNELLMPGTAAQGQTRRRRQRPAPELPMPGNLRNKFEALWNDRRYTKPRAPKNRSTCETFSEEANSILAHVPKAQLPHGVCRAPDGSIGSFAIVANVDWFRDVLTGIDDDHRKKDL